MPPSLQNTFFLLFIQCSLATFPIKDSKKLQRVLNFFLDRSAQLAKSKSYSVVPAQQTEVLKEKLKRLNDLEKESGANIDQTSSDEDIEKVRLR